MHNGPYVPHNLSIAVLLLAFAAPLFAQTGSISGSIVDASSTCLPSSSHQVFGSNLDAMRSYHSDVGVEGPLERSVTWQVSAYNREDRDYPWLPGAQFRVANGRLVLPSFTTRYDNARDGHSRGVELVVHRRSPNGLSGWIAYNLASTRYRTGNSEPALGTFPADYDQRHTVNMYGVYRFSDRMSFSARFRAGRVCPRQRPRRIAGHQRHDVPGVRAVRLDVPADSVGGVVVGVLIFACLNLCVSQHGDTESRRRTENTRRSGSVGSIDVVGRVAAHPRGRKGTNTRAAGSWLLYSCLFFLASAIGATSMPAPCLRVSVLKAALIPRLRATLFFQQPMFAG